MIGTRGLISKKASIDALDEIHHALWEIDIPSPTVPEYIEHHESVKKVMKVVLKKREELKNLPSRKKGKWLLNDDGTPAICSECGTNWINDYVDSRELYFTGKIPNYCPNCGSDNRGEQDD